jgi:hypothetical protein
MTSTWTPEERAAYIRGAATRLRIARLYGRYGHSSLLESPGLRDESAADIMVWGIASYVPASTNQDARRQRLRQARLCGIPLTDGWRTSNAPRGEPFSFSLPSPYIQLDEQNQLGISPNQSMRKN